MFGELMGEVEKELGDREVVKMEGRDWVGPRCTVDVKERSQQFYRPKFLPAK